MRFRVPRRSWPRYVPEYDASGNPFKVVDLGYAAVGIASALIDNPTQTNPGNVLAYNAEDIDGQHLNNRFRAGEFRLYDEYDRGSDRARSLGQPLEVVDPGRGRRVPAQLRRGRGRDPPAGTVPKSTGQQASSYPQVNDDGDDKIFGDLGNDWIVGGTAATTCTAAGQRPVERDDTHATNGGLNDVPTRTRPTRIVHTVARAATC